METRKSYLLAGEGAKSQKGAVGFVKAARAVYPLDSYLFTSLATFNVVGSSVCCSILSSFTWAALLSLLVVATGFSSSFFFLFCCFLRQHLSLTFLTPFPIFLHPSPHVPRPIVQTFYPFSQSQAGWEWDLFFSPSTVSFSHPLAFYLLRDRSSSLLK